MVTTVCAQCGSRLRPEDDWCSLCLHPRDGVAAPEPPPPAVPEPEEPQEPPTTSGDAETSLPEAWEDGVVLTGPRRKVEARAEAAASADRLIAQLAASERRAVRDSRLGRLQSEVAARTGLTPSGAGTVIGIASGVTLLITIIVALTVLGLFL